MLAGAVALSFRSAWRRMQAELTVDGRAFWTEGPLSHREEEAGWGWDDQLQRHITSQREAVAKRQLELDINALPTRDPRRVAFSQVDQFSRQFLTTWTRADWALHDEACSLIPLPSSWAFRRP